MTLLQERTQTTMIVSWLTEIFLNQMGRLKEQDVLDQYGQLQDQFRAFLSTPRVKVWEQGWWYVGVT